MAVPDLYTYRIKYKQGNQRKKKRRKKNLDATTQNQNQKPKAYAAERFSEIRLFHSLLACM
jgi:hypothetical protein